MKYYKKILENIMRVQLILGGFLAVLMVVIMCCEVVMRYVFSKPIIWTQETAIFLFILIVAIGGSIAAKLQCHIKIDTLYHFIPKSLQKVFQVVASVILMATLVFLIWKFPAAIKMQNMTKTSSMLINFPRGYYFSVPFQIAFIGMLLTKIYYFIYEVKVLLGKPIPDDYVIKMVSAGQIGSWLSGKERKR